MFKMVFQLVFGLIIVFGLMYGGVFLLKYLIGNEKIKKIIQASSERQRIVVKSRAKLSPKHVIAIVEIDDREIVVGLSDSGMSLLDVSLKEGQ